MKGMFRSVTLFTATMTSVAFLLAGCSGDDGSNGPAGADGADGQDVVVASTAVKLAATGVTVPTTAGVEGTVIKFKVTDSTTSKAVTSLPAGAAVSFTFAKLDKDAKGYTKWTSYINRDGAIAGKDAVGSGTGGTPVITTPVLQATTQSAGTDLVNLGGGEYSFAFTSSGLTTAGFPARIAFAASATNRIGIQINGGGLKAANIVYDFVPAGGTPTVTRNIVSTDSCLECHGTRDIFGFHGSSARKEVEYCVTCHNTGSTDPNSGETVDMANMIHKIHMGEHLPSVEAGGKYIIFGYSGSTHDYSEVGYPQDVRNCTKCHKASTATPDGDNWKTKPSRNACGACHDDVNFATGAGHSLANYKQATDDNCAQCHTAEDVVNFHYTVDMTGSNGRGGYPANTAVDVPSVGYGSGQGPSIPVASQLNSPAGVYKMDLEIKKVTVEGEAGAKKAKVVYRILKDGVPVTLNATGYLINNVDGAPSIQVSYAIPQDGIVAPADWNKNISATVKELRDGVKGTQSATPDADKYYTATLSTVIPDNATMVTGAIGINYQGFVQLGHAEYPNGIRLREPAFVMKNADGFTARRSIVDNAKCNKCHGQLGISPSFHSGARNNGAGCSLGGCHDPNKATGHVGPSYSFGGGWSVNSKDLIHGIHGSAKRSVPFTYEATAENPNGFGHVTYPTSLKNCEACHVAGSYDFRTAANLAAVPNLLWSTAAAGNMTNDGTTNPTGIASIGLSPWVTLQTNYSGRANNLIITPVAAACFGCHDDSIAVSHMKQNGGKIYQAFGTGGNTETCMICHGPNRTADIKAAHQF